jgi:hypothetical protein
MSRFNQLPPDLIKEISNLLGYRTTRNAFRQSNDYVLETLGPSEIGITELPQDMIKEIGKYLKGPSKTSYRSAHPNIRKSTMDMKSEIKEIVKSRLKLMTNGLQGDLYRMKELIEDMFEMYTGDRVVADWRQNNYGIYFIIQPYVITSFLEDNLQSTAPSWFNDVIKGTNFNYWIQKIGLYEMLQINQLHYSFKKNFDSWNSFLENISLLIIDWILISKGYDDYVEAEINLKNYEMLIEKELTNQTKQLKIKIKNNKDGKEENIIFRIKGGKYELDANPKTRKFILDIVNGTKFWYHFDHLFESVDDGNKFWPNLNKLFKTLM